MQHLTRHPTPSEDKKLFDAVTQAYILEIAQLHEQVRLLELKLKRKYPPIFAWLDTRWQ